MPYTPKAVIFGCKSTTLSSEERSLFAQHNPVGFILFSRNIDTPEQVKTLITELKSLVSHESCLILVDQEGGRVARLKPPHWQKYPPAATFAALAKKDLEKASQAVYLNHRLIGEELHTLGFNVDCAPVLDIPVEGSDAIISDRAFGTEPKQVSVLARAACEGLLASGILPIIKHIPGHGRAMVDSHLELPVVDTDIETLERTDFAVFQALADLPFAMTAHVEYSLIDSHSCATLSRRVINMVRHRIGFKGLLLTDDLSMKALSGSFSERTQKALSAGCDIVLHCNGEIDEMLEIVSATPRLSDDAHTKLNDACKTIEPMSTMINSNDIQQKISQLLA